MCIGGAMAREVKTGYRSRTFRLSDKMMKELKEVADREGRTVTAQLERFVNAGIAETKKVIALEKKSGNSRALDKAA
jgi:hypothetical protein